MEDVQGSDKRVYRSVLIGLATGEGSLTKPEAKRKLKELLHQMGVNTEAHLVKSVNPIETFRQRAKWWENNKAVFFKPATRNTMVNHIDKWILSRLGDLPVDEVNERAVQEFISDLHRDGKLAPKSILNVIGVIKLIVGEKVWRDWTLKLPTIPRTEQPYFTPEQMVAIIAKAPECYKVLFSVLAGTGMRIGEAVGLHVEDLNLVNGTISIQRSVWRGQEQAPKTTNAFRKVTIDQNLVALLITHLNGKKTGRLFESRLGTPLNANNISKRVLKTILIELKLEGSFHSFRHGRVSVLQQAGIPSDLVKEWVGHSSLRTTSRYTHFDDKFRSEIVGRLTPFTPLSEEKAKGALAQA